MSDISVPDKIVAYITLAALDDPPILETEDDRSRYVSRLLTSIKALDEQIMLSRKHSAKSVPPAASRKRR